MKKVIIGIHGLANKPEKGLLQRWWRDSMIEGFKLHGIEKELPEFELVYWADIIYDKPLDPFERDLKSRYYLDEPYTQSSVEEDDDSRSMRQKFNDFMTSQLNRIFLNDDKTLNYTFITDMLINKYFNDLQLYYTDGGETGALMQNRVRERIRERVIETIRRYKGYDICIVAHSMGSIIAYDVLSYYLPDIRIKAFITIGSPLGLPIVTSKIIEEHRKRDLDSGTLRTPPGIEWGWFNLADLKDPVAIDYKLSDNFTSNRRGVAPSDFLVYNNYQINGTKNPHKSFGYLRSGEFSGILSEFIDIKQVTFAERLFRKIRGVLVKGRTNST
jgi:hypothetical protein